jgi:predicted enzyme related to lactoylglutathione lyase
MDMKLELIVIPVSDLDRAKEFYSEKVGFNLDIDFRGPGELRAVQLTPPGSACSIALMENPEQAGSVQGLHLVVTDIEAARRELMDRGIEASNYFHFGEAGQTRGLDPKRAPYGSFFGFLDPDGTGWLVQEVPA